MSKVLTEQDRAEIAEIAALPDDEIDTVDIPEAPTGNWANARRGGAERLPKLPVTIRLDTDIVAWFREHAPAGRYQSEINRVLRGYVESARKR